MKYSRRGAAVFERASARLYAAALVVAITVLSVAGGMLVPAAASAAPALSVSKAIASKPLLGGTATYTITVQNTGLDKGYNLSLTDVLSSSRPNPQGRVTFVSASDSSGAQYPTSVSTSTVTGDTTVKLLNIKDLAPTETYRLTFTVDLAGDPTWRVGDLLNDAVTATVAEFPDGSGATYTGSASRSDDVLPIKLVSKNCEQSTGVEQATGTEDRVFHYSLQVRNNYLNTTNGVVLTDILPDGVEFLGVTSGPALDPGYPQRDPVTGETTLRWTLGDMAAAQVGNIRYAAGIRYDYYGTADGGTNRPTADFSGTPPLGTPIPDKTTFTNQADIAATYQGTPVTDQAAASVSGAYLTIAKSGTPTTGGNGTVVSYTLTYSASQYYDILKDPPGSITVTDTVPNGQTYRFDGSPAPSDISPNADGTTTITWDSATLAALAHSAAATITFSASIDDDWRGPVIGGLPIIAGDSLTNWCGVSGTWEDQVDGSRSDQSSSSSASAHFSTSLPKVHKQVEDPPGSGTWVQTTSRTVGDTVKFRVRFNTTNGSTPTNSDIKMGRITVTDWLPPGMTFNNDAVITPSAVADFSDPGGGPPINVTGPPAVVALGGLQGLEWYLGNVTSDGWWQAVFTAHIDDVPAVADGVSVNNLWKLTGINTVGAEYSDRDAAAVDYTAPFLTLMKTATTVPNPLLPGGNVRYTTTITNSGHAAARDVLVTDTLPAGMRLAAPTMVSASLDGTPLAAGTGYVLAPAYDSGTGVFSIDLENGGVHTAIPAGSTLTFVYQAQVDATGGVAGKALTNIATVGYNTQADGSGRATPGTSNVADPNTDDATVTLANLAITKSAIPATPVTIGDTLTYTLRVTVPAGEIAYWPRLQDIVNRDGVAYDASLTPALATVSGTPVTAAAFAGGSAPTVSTTGANTTTFTWLLADPIDNRGHAADYVFTLTFRVLVNGLEDNGSWEFWLPTATDQIGDRGRVDWNTTDPASRPGTTDKNVQTGLVQSNVDQPLLALHKAVVSSGPYAGGSQVIYETTVTNNGWSSAYDIAWADALPAGLESPALVSVTKGGTPLVPGTDFTSDFTGDPQTIDFNGGTSHTSLAAGASLVVRYTAQVRNDVGSGATLTNTADVDWASKDGAPAGSRVYNDGPQETGYTADTDTASITTRQAALTKSVTPATARVGETLTYTVLVTVPAETVAYGPDLTDAIGTDGMSYVPGSAVVTDVSGDPQTHAVLTGVTEDTSPIPGSTIHFHFQTPIDNADPGHPIGDQDYVFDLTFQVQVTGKDDGGGWLWSPTAGPVTSSDTATFAWNDGTSPHSSQASADETIKQPVLDMTKTFSDRTPASATAPIDSTVTITNNGWATAYEDGGGYDFVDTPPSCFEAATNVTVTHSVLGPLAAGADYTVSFSGTTLRIEYTSAKSDLAPGEALTITYRNAFVRPPDPDAPAAGAAYANAAAVKYTSMPGDVTGERTYGTSASDHLTMPLAGLTKVCGAPGGVASIGQQFDYTLTLEVPAGVLLHDAQVVDTMPDGVTVVATGPTPGTTTVTPHADGTTTVTWDLPAAWGQTVPPTQPVVPTLTITVRVDDTYANGTPVSGLPAPLGPGQDTLTNSAIFTWHESPGGPSHSTGDQADFTVVEPHLTIAKSFDNTTPSTAADIITSTVVIGNDGVSTAYESSGYDFVDTPPSCFVAATNVTVTHSVHGALTPGADYTVSFSGTTLRIEYTSAHTDLTPGETLTITYRNAFVQPPDPDAPAAGGTYSNAAVAHAGSVPGGGRDYSDSASDSLTMGGVGISKSADAPGGVVTIGQTYHYRVTLGVPAGTTLYSATVTDAVPDGLTVTGATANPGNVITTPNADGTTTVLWTLPSVWQQGAPTVTPTLTITVRVDDTYHDGTPVSGLPAPLGPGQDVLHNVATLDYLDGPSGQHQQATDAVDETVVEPHLTIDKQADPTTAGPGDPVSYTIALGNDGTSAAHSLVLSEQVPAELFASGTSPAVTSVRLDGVPLTPGVDYTAALLTNPITITFADPIALAPGSGLEIVLTAHVNGGVEGGLTLTNTASATWSSTLGPDARDYGPISASADLTTLAPVLSLEKTVVGESTVNRYDEVTFSITVTNTGDAAAHQVDVSDDLPAGGFTYVAGSTQASWPGGSSITHPAVTGGTHLTWPLHATLAPQASLVLTFRMHVGMVALQDYTNAAAATGTDGGGTAVKPPSGSADLTVVKPEVTHAALQLTKKLAKGQPRTVGLGDPVKYTIVITNTGDTSIVTLPLSDTYPRAALRYVSASLMPTSTHPAGVLQWADVTGAGYLEPGASITLRLKFAARRFNGVVVNTADVLGAIDEYQDPVPDAQSAAQVRIRLKAKLIALKTGKDISGWPPVPGHVVSWKITVKNVAQATLTNVVITDTIARWQRYRRGSIRGTGSDDSRAPHLAWRIKSLKPGRTVVVSFRAVIVPGTPPGSKICNQARVDSDQTRPVVTDDPFTTQANDTTVLNPDASGLWWLLWVTLGVAGAATAIWAIRRRRRSIQAR